MTGTSATAFWVTGAAQGALLTETLPPPGADEVLIETLYSGISRGTESLVFRQRIPPSEWQRMRCPFQAGDFPAPVKYGYSAVGRVRVGPVELTERLVFVLHPHQDRFVVPASAITPVPETVPAGRAILAANMETALNGVWDAEIRPGDRVCVIGAGVVGLLAAWLARGIVGVEAVLFDVEPAKATAAAALGVAFTTEAAGLRDFDVVIHASGCGEGLATALEVAAFEAMIVDLSWYGDASVTLPLGRDFHVKRLRIRSSQVGAVAAAQRPRWTHRRRLAKALAMLAEPALDALISGESAFADLPSAMMALSAGAAPALCHRIVYPH